MSSNDHRRPPSEKAPHAPAARTQAARRLNSAELFAGAVELLIQHDDREYRLRITQNGRLILTA